MDASTNKRKAPTSPPSTPCPAPPPKGARFFPPAFGSPGTMPKRTTVPALEYLTSPTPAPANANATAPQGSPTPTQQKPPPAQPTAPNTPTQTSRPDGEDTDMADPQETQEGLHESIHAPTRPPLEKTAPPPQTTSAHTPHSVTATPDLFLTLSAVAESTQDMVSFSSSTLTESRFTRPLEGTFPTTYRGIPGEFLQGLPSDTVQAWCELAPPKFFIRFFGYDGSEQRVKHQELIGLFRNAVQEIAETTGEKELTARIAPPPTPTSLTAQPLITFLAHRISQLTTDLILCQRVWSFPEVTFEAIPFETITIPKLILCIAGFTSPDESSVEEAILKVWDEEQTKSRLTDILQQHDPLFKGKSLRLAAKEAIEEMTETMTVELVDYKSRGGIPSPRFNVFAHPPTNNLLAWSQLRALLFSKSYPSLLCGEGRPTKLFSCQICHSFSHPRGLCLFPHLPGWNGPKHEPDRLASARGRGHGRGRGRGGRGTPA